MASIPRGTLHVDVPEMEHRTGVHRRTIWEEGDGKAVLARSWPGAGIPRHRHLGNERNFVLEGSVTDENGTCTAGNSPRRPPGCEHRVVSRDGALVLAGMPGAPEALPPA